jgi:hypothetical protein
MTVAIPAGVFANSNVLLRVWFNDGINGFQQLSPDQQLGAAGYALQAQNAAVAATANATAPSSLIQGSVLNIGSANVVTGQYASVAGGTSNTASGPYAFVGGGTGNQASGTNTTVVGGSGNAVYGSFSFIGAGVSNIIDGFFSPCFFGAPGYVYLGGGQYNTCDSSWAAVVGGFSNLINPASEYSTVGGGELNTIDCMSPESTISGGSSNIIQGSSYDSTIGGGATNTIQSGSPLSTIGGGFVNTIQSNSYRSTIAGGAGNTIQSSADGSAIGGGAGNAIQFGAGLSTIAGGSGNFIQTNANNSTIGGGAGNFIQTNAGESTIAGGGSNTIQLNAGESTIAGGEYNTIQSGAYSATIGGGTANVIGNNYATIPGGQQAQATNYAQMAYSSGSFTTAGDGQFSLYVLRGLSGICSTNGGVGNGSGTLYLDYPADSLEIALPADRACAYTIRIVGRESQSGPGGHTSSYCILGSANGWDNTVQNNGPTAGALENTISPTPSPQITVSSGKLHVQMTNYPTNICVRWVATVETAEVSYP